MLQDIPTPTLREASSCVLETERLALRRPTLADVKAIAHLANDRRIAENTRRLPHPYLQDHAVEFVRAIAARSPRDRVPDRAQHIRRSAWSASTGASRTRRNSATGSASSIGASGFGTEAARAVIDFSFEEFDAEHLISGARVANPASRNILEKCGFQWSGVELHRFEALGSSTPVDCFRLSRERVVVAEELGQFDAARAVARSPSSARKRRDDEAPHTGGLTTASSRPSFCSRRKM